MLRKGVSPQVIHILLFIIVTCICCTNVWWAHSSLFLTDVRFCGNCILRKNLYIIIFKLNMHTNGLLLEISFFFAFLAWVWWDIFLSLSPYLCLNVFHYIYLRGEVRWCILEKQENWGKILLQNCLSWRQIKGKENRKINLKFQYYFSKKSKKKLERATFFWNLHFWCSLKLGIFHVITK